MCAQLLKSISPGVELLEKWHEHLKLCFPNGLCQFTLPPRVCGRFHHSHLVKIWHWDCHQSYPYKMVSHCFPSLFIYNSSFSSSTLIYFASIKEKISEIQKSWLTFIQEIYLQFVLRAHSLIHSTNITSLRIQRQIRHLLATQELMVLRTGQICKTNTKSW